MSTRFPGVRWSPVALLALSLGTSTALAQSTQTRARVHALDSIAAADVRQNRAVGTVAAVIKGADTLLFEGYGRANVEWDVPMPTDAMFEIGSVTRQFTAVAILQLRDQGKLSLDADITKWLPDFDTRGNEVPLRRMLDHTSGITDVTLRPGTGHRFLHATMPNAWLQFTVENGRATRVTMHQNGRQMSGLRRQRRSRAHHTLHTGSIT